MSMLRDNDREIKKKYGFLKNVLTLITGTAFAQIIPIIISPILTRLYGPVEFGTYALFVSVSSILVVISALGYDLAVMLPKRDSRAFMVVIIGFLCATLFSILHFVFIRIFGGKVLEWVGYSALIEWAYFWPIYLILSGFKLTLQYWTNRSRQYTILSVSRLIQALTVAAVSLSLGFWGRGVSGLILGLIAGQVSGFIILLYFFLTSARHFWIRIKISELFIMLKRYREFPLLNAPTAMLQSAAVQAPALIMGIAYSPVNIGYYGLSNRIVRMPITLIGNAIGEVFYKESMACRHKDVPLTPLLLKTSQNLFLIGLGPAVLFFFTAPDLFEFLFSQEWRVAGEYVQILTFSFLIKFSVAPISKIFFVSGNTKKAAYWRIIYLLSVYLTLWFASLLTIKSFLIVYVIHECLLYSYYFYLAAKSASNIKTTA